MRKLYILELAAALWLCMAGSVSAEILHMGMRGAAVESLQNDLVEAGYLARTVDGDYGSTTVKAVSEFQKDHGLPVTGKADDSTPGAACAGKGAASRAPLRASRARSRPAVWNFHFIGSNFPPCFIPWDQRNAAHMEKFRVHDFSHY